MSEPCLLDASVWLAALDRDDRFHNAARALVEAAAEGAQTLAALDLTLYEIANVAVLRWHSSSAANDLVRLVTLACPDTFERSDSELLEDAIEIAADHALTVYDAAYVAAGRRRRWMLVSADVSDLVTPGHAVTPEQAAAG